MHMGTHCLHAVHTAVCSACKQRADEPRRIRGWRILREEASAPHRPAFAARTRPAMQEADPMRFACGRRWLAQRRNGQSQSYQEQLRQQPSVGLTACTCGRSGTARRGGRPPQTRRSGDCAQRRNCPVRHSSAKRNAQRTRRTKWFSRIAIRLSLSSGTTSKYLGSATVGTILGATRRISSPVPDR